MRIQRRRPSELANLRAGIAVVIDVLRMTSTASVLMRRASRESIAVAATLDDLDRLPRPRSEHLIVSELAGAPALGAWVDNSPAQVAAMDLGDRTPVLVTTNGTRALGAAAASAEQVLLASLLDVHAVAKHLSASPEAEVVIVPAGHFESGEPRIEDDLCADALASLLLGREPDLDAAAALIRAEPRVRRRVEAEPGYAADLEVALARDPGAAVLCFQPLDAGTGTIVRVAEVEPARRDRDRSQRT